MKKLAAISFLALSFCFQTKTCIFLGEGENVAASNVITRVQSKENYLFPSEGHSSSNSSRASGTGTPINNRTLSEQEQIVELKKQQEQLTKRLSEEKKRNEELENELKLTKEKKSSIAIGSVAASLLLLSLFKK